MEEDLNVRNFIKNCSYLTIRQSIVIVFCGGIILQLGLIKIQLFCQEIFHKRIGLVSYKVTIFLNLFNISK